jgi:hypothetical protein
LKYLLIATHVPASGAGGGMIRYTVELMLAYRRELAEEVDLHVACTQGAASFFRKHLPARSVHVASVKMRVLRSLAERWALDRLIGRHEWDVIHGPKHLLPRGHKASLKVLTVHDMLPFDRPADFGLMKRLLLRRPYLASISESDLCLCVSSATLERLHSYAGRHASPSAVVPLAMSSTLSAARSVTVAGLGDVQFALVVGDASPRKNLSLPVSIWPSVRGQYPKGKLVVVGPKDWLHSERGKEWEELISSGAVLALGHVADGELRWLYEHAAVVLCPSLLEGFGLPALEASVFGARTVISLDPAMGEAAPDARSIDVEDYCAWRDAVCEAFGQVQTRETRAGRIRSWEDVARESLAEIEAALISRG